MAKSKGLPPSSNGKMTIMFVQMEGDDATLQEGFKAFAAAVARIPSSNGRHSTPAINGSQQPPQAKQDDEEANDDDDVFDSEPVQTAASGQTKRSPPASPIILDIDLKQGEVNLKDFIAKYHGDDISKRYLLIAYWMKVYASIEEVSMNHIHTAYRFLGWITPKDAAQPLRKLKSSAEWMNKGASKGMYKINHVGENEVLKITNDAR